MTTRPHPVLTGIRFPDTTATSQDREQPLACCPQAPGARPWLLTVALGPDIPSGRFCHQLSLTNFSFQKQV